MAGDSLRIEIDADTRKAISQLNELNKSLGDSEKAGEKAGFMARDLGISWARAGAVAAGTVVAFGAAARAIAQGAAAAETNARVTRQLGDAYAAVQRQTDGAVSAAEAMRAQQTLMRSGLQLSGEELGRVTRAAREFALATGTETSAALEQLTGALRGGEAEGLRAFGITLEANSTRSHSFRTALNQLEAQQRAMAPSAQTMAEANAEMGRSWDALTSGIASNIAEWTNLREAIGGALQMMRDVQAAEGDLTAVLTGNTRRERDQQAREADENRQDSIRAGFIQVRQRTARRLGAQEETFGNANILNEAQLSNLAIRLERATNIAEYMAIAAESRGTDGDNRAARARVAASSAARVAAEPAARDAHNALSNARGAPASYDSARFEIIDALRDLLRSAAAEGRGFNADALGYGSSASDVSGTFDLLRGSIGGAATGRVSRRPGESSAAYQQRVIAALQADAGTRGTKGADAAAFARQQSIAMDDATEAKRVGSQNTQSEYEFANAAGQEEMRLASQAKGVTFAAAENDNARRENVGAQFRDAFLPAALQTQTAAEKMAEGVSGAFATMTGAVKSHVGALIEGRETAGQAMLGIAHDTLLALATEAVGRSLMSLGGALAATAIGSPTAPLLYASAAAYAGVAALAGAGAAATGAAMAGASSPAASAGRAPPAAASAGGSGRGSSEGTNVTINVNGTVMDREGTANAVLDALNDSLSRGGVLRAA